MKVDDREEAVFNLMSINQSFVSVIAITLSQFSLKPLTFETSFLANGLYSYLLDQNRFCM